jgi:uncharacterized membrane protein YqjE
MTALEDLVPRELGWVLAVFGAVLVLMMTVIIVIVAVFADEPWGDVAPDFLAFWALGALGGAAGVRMLRRYARQRRNTEPFTDSG